MVKKNKIYPKVWALSLLSAILLAVPFLVPHCGLVSLFALVPLFMAEEIVRREGRKHFIWVVYCSFLVWNLLATFWVYFATVPGAIAAFVLNTLQMTIIFALFRWFRRKVSGYLPYLFFCFAWVAWEHAYFTWQISWPWLVLGNAFATSIKNIQWYEYTGTVGGSFWILLVNTLIYRVIYLVKNNQRSLLQVGSLILLIIVPTTISHVIFSNYREDKNPVKVGILQPNIDPYNSKFKVSQDKQDDILFKLANESLREFAKNEDSLNNDILLLAPETFISPNSWRSRVSEIEPARNKSYNKFNNFVETHSDSLRDVSFIVGAVTIMEYMQANQPNITSRKMPGGWYDNYNSAIMLTKADSVVKTDFYHKSKLVILAESNPFLSGPFKFMDKLVYDIAGGVGNFGTQKDRGVFEFGLGKAGTAICYESVYGDFYREWALNGAEFMTIITNDGWWRNTPGHKQHLHYASLRAIETRRSIARCANTGISAFINQRGEIESKTNWWQECYLNGVVNKNTSKTIFVQYGDIIGRVSSFVFFMFLLLGIVTSVMARTKKKDRIA